MTNPFSHDTTSNARTDHSFSTDQGIAPRHLVSFAAAMDAPASNLGETDYRYPGARPGADDRFADNAPRQPVQSWEAPNSPRPGYFPRGWAP